MQVVESTQVIQYLLGLVAILIALTIHEAAHALVAYWLGDSTAKNLGRISLNPIKHLDLYGSLLFLVIGIGWGKPVPVNPNNFQHPIRDNALTALAGPASNFILATGILLTLKVFPILFSPDSLIFYFISYVIQINILLGFFNLIPFPPLDGSKIIGLVIPKKWHYQYAQFTNNALAYALAFIVIDSYILGRYFGFSLISTYLQLTTGWFITLLS